MSSEASLVRTTSISRPYPPGLGYTPISTPKGTCCLGWAGTVQIICNTPDSTARQLRSPSSCLSCRLAVSGELLRLER